MAEKPPAPPVGLAALFAKKPLVGVPAALPSAPKPPSADFFAMMRKTSPSVEPGPPPKPFAVPELFKARPSAPGVDIRQAATAAMGAKGYFDKVDPSPEATTVERPFAAFSDPGLPGPFAFAGFGKAAIPGKKKGPAVERSPNKTAPSLGALFGLEEEPTFKKGSKIDEARRREGVKDSKELQRILKIARRPQNGNTPDLTDEFRKASGTMDLWPKQSQSLDEIRKNNGGFLTLGVGQGKTIVSLLAGKALNARQTVILVPPALRAQLLGVDIPRLSKEWQIPLAKLRVVAYSQLSSAANQDILETIGPDLIVCDEAHALRYKAAARTKRFLRYAKLHPECRFVFMSGTMTRRGIADYQHLAELAIGKNSPVPNHYPTLVDWAQALDVSDDPMPPGALLSLCSDEELQQIGEAKDPEEIQKIARGAFRRRLVETPGVVATEESALGTSLIINAVKPLVPSEVQVAISDVRTRWEIGGEELTDALSVARVTRQLAAGFWYRWVWPDGKPDVEWLECRRAWGKEVREILRLSRPGMDSPMLVAQAVEKGKYQSLAYEAWRKVKDRPEPPREAVWLNDFLVREAIKWAEENANKANPAILWYSHDAVGRKLAELSKFPFFGPGSKASEELTKVDARKTPVIICSAKAHGTGKNLQAFCLNLLTTPISSGADAEQLIARTHRPGQESDEVRVDVFVHTIETMAAFRSSVLDAAYIEQTTGQRQKLNFAERLGFGDGMFDFATGTRAKDVETSGIVWKSGGIEDLFKRK